MVSIKQLLEWFTTGKFPTESQFQEQFKSFWHKSEKIAMTSILGLLDIISKLATKDELQSFANGVIRQDAVPTFSQLPKNPQLGWDVLVLDQNMRYNWNGTKWVSMNTGVYDGADKADKRTIYNVSQLNDKYDYTTNVLARNAVTAGFRTLGMIISYRLSTNEWVTEQYLAVNAANWSANENWKYIGGLLPEDIYQKVDDTTDKPISPKGVKTGLLGVDGLGYRETSTPPTFANVITSYNYKAGYYLDKDVEIANTGYSHNQDYVAVKPNTKYLHSSIVGPAVLFYRADKTYISQAAGSLGGSFTTPIDCVFVRYNIHNAYDGEGYYMYEASGITNVSDKIGVLVSVGDMIGAVKTDASISSGSILPATITFDEKAFDGNGNPTIGGNNLKHSVDYIPIAGGVSYETNLSNLKPFMWFYDSAKRIISYIGTALTGMPFGAFITPVNAAYFRFNTQTVNMNPFYVRRTSGNDGAYTSPIWSSRKPTYWTWK